MSATFGTLVKATLDERPSLQLSNYTASDGDTLRRTAQNAEDAMIAIKKIDADNQLGSSVGRSTSSEDWAKELVDRQKQSLEDALKLGGVGNPTQAVTEFEKSVDVAIERGLRIGPKGQTL